MKRFLITTIVSLIMPVFSYSQAFFTIDAIGGFHSGDKDYYVMDVPGMNQNELEELLFGRMDEMYREPAYFEYPKFIARTGGKVEFTYEMYFYYPEFNKKVWDSTLQFEYSFSIQCKDERFRINDPRLESVYYGASTKWYPEEWIRETRFGKYEDRNWTMYVSEYNFNRAILDYFTYLVKDEMFSFNDSITLSSPDTVLFSLTQEKPLAHPYFKYESSTTNRIKNYINISMPGLTKKELIDILDEAFHREYRGKRVYGVDGGILKYENGITIDSRVKIDCNVYSVTDILSNNSRSYEFDYSIALVCSDEVIQVWAPKISVVRTENGALYRSLGRFCQAEGLYTLSGALKQTDKAQKIISCINTKMNKLIWTPLYALQQSVLNPAPPVEEKEEEW